MTLRFFSFLMATLLSTTVSFTQSPDCWGASEICLTDITTYPAPVNNPPAQPGMNYGCLTTQPNPAWFHIVSPFGGTLGLTLQSTTGMDIDYAIWGPFPDSTTAQSACYTPAFGVPFQCSYSPSPVENAFFTAQPGMTYVLLITNFSNQPTEYQINAAGSGVSPCGCLADAGVIDTTTLVTSPGDSSLLLLLNPTFSPPFPLTPFYDFAIIECDTIREVGPIPVDLTSYPPGEYEVCGLAHSLDNQTLIDSLVGMHFDTVNYSFFRFEEDFCGSFTEDCKTVIIEAPSGVAELDTLICGGTCFNAALFNTTYCQSGSYSDTLLGGNFNGGDSILNLQLAVLSPDTLYYQDIGCVNECLDFADTTLCLPDVYTFNFINQYGCDSIVILNWEWLDFTTVLTPPDTLSCDFGASVLLSGTTINVDSTYQLSYIWQGPNIIDSSGAAEIVVDLPGTYCLSTVVQTLDSLICEDTQCIEVIQEDLPPAVPILDGFSSVCYGEDALFTILTNGIDSNLIYQFIVAGDTLPVQQFPNTSITIPNLIDDLEVCVTAENNCGTSPITCFTTTILALPTAQIISSEDICEATRDSATIMVTLTGQAPFSLIYSKDGILQTDTLFANSHSFGFSVNSAGNYQIEQVIDNNGCIGTGQGMIASVSFIPIIEVQNLVRTFPSTGFYTIHFDIWGGDQNSISIAPSSGILTGTIPVQFTSDPIPCEQGYRFTIRDTSNCETVVIEDGPISLPASPILVGDTLICANETVVFTANPNGDSSLIYHFELSNDSLPFNLLSVNAIEIPQLTEDLEVCVFTENECGFSPPTCLVTTVLPLPSSQIISWEDICESTGDSIDILLSLEGETPFELVYSIDNIVQMDTLFSNDSLLTLSTNEPGTYAIESIVDANGCIEDTMEEEIEVQLIPVFDIQNLDTSFATLDTTYIISFDIFGGDANSVFTTPSAGSLTGTGPVHFESVPIPCGAGYSFLISDESNCESIVVADTAIICPCSIRSITNDTTVCFGEPLSLSVLATNATQYQWSPTNQLSCADCPDPQATIQEDITYQVTVSNDEGCELIDSVQIVQTCWLVFEDIKIGDIGYRNLFYPPYELAAQSDACNDFEDNVDINFTNNIPDSLLFVGEVPGKDTVCLQFIHPQNPSDVQILTIIIQVRANDIFNRKGISSGSVMSQAEQHFLEVSSKSPSSNYFNFYPNPVKESLFLASNQAMLEINIYSLAGELVMSQTVEKTRDYELPLRLVAGVYTLEVITEGETWSELLLKFD